MLDSVVSKLKELNYKVVIEQGTPIVCLAQEDYENDDLRTKLKTLIEETGYNKSYGFRLDQ